VKAAGVLDWQAYHLQVADYLEICEPERPGTLRAWPGL
jgi:hypothetical protein